MWKCQKKRRKKHEKNVLFLLNMSRKENVDIDILIKLRIGDWKIMQLIGIASIDPTRIKTWSLFSQFKWSSKQFK